MDGAISIGQRWGAGTPSWNGLDPRKTAPYCPLRLKAMGLVRRARPTRRRWSHGCYPPESRARQGTTDQSLPETAQALRPPGTWAVPGASSFTATGPSMAPVALARRRCSQGAPHLAAAGFLPACLSRGKISLTAGTDAGTLPPPPEKTPHASTRPPFNCPGRLCVRPCGQPHGAGR